MFNKIRPVLALLASTLFLVAGVGLGNLLVPLRAHEEGWSASVIGILGAVYATAFTLGCLFVPKLVLRLGHVRLFGVLLAMLAASLILISMVVHPVMWALFRAISGFALAGGYMIIESWLNERADNESRGMVFSVYMMVCMVAIIAGQFMLPLSSPGEPTLFLVAALLFLGAALPTGLSSAQSPKPLEQVSLDFRKLYRNSPAAAVGAFVAGVSFGVWSGFSALYGQNAGLDGTGIATLLMTATVGALVFQFPIGKVSDLVDRRFVMVALGVVGSLAALYGMILLPGATLTLFAVYFVIGAVVYPQYAVNVSHANDHAVDGDFVAISGAMMIIYGIGSMVGPLLTGTVIDALGYRGFFGTLLGGFAIYAAFSFWRILQREAPHREATPEFQVLPINKTPTPQTYALDPRAE